LNKLIERLTTLNDFSEAKIEQTFTAVLRELGLSMGQLAQPVRVALTGSSVSPGIHEVIAVLGKQRTLQRLHTALARLPP
jgi:glutamyl-tRNA synthetase